MIVSSTNMKTPTTARQSHINVRKEPRHKLKSYLFRLVIEESSPEDGTKGYRAYIPSLEKYGASAWSVTKAVALREIQWLAEMIVEKLLEDGETIPTDVEAGIQGSKDLILAVTR